MEENVGNPLILGRPFLATSRALINMESGELMLRIHDECLVLQVYKALHQSSRDSMSYMKMEEGNPPSPAPPDKGPKKKSKEEKGNHDSVKFQQIQQISHVPYLPVIVGSNNKASSKGIGNQTFEPP
ncbi:hypothetical protein PIB30_094451 [Stylosanthes scabra]|uniref:Uncharacterized protein n=1 Tax=Stylosanthes scabra TaxID=79078 RepID=A0ABU6YY72_9FABA|nr:hypothetical protein [Stylosanthes scabra]